MFDSREIARSALNRADEIKLVNKRRVQIAKGASAVAGTCMAVALMIMVGIPAMKPQGTQIADIDEIQVPLGSAISTTETIGSAKSETETIGSAISTVNNIGIDENAVLFTGTAQTALVPGFLIPAYDKVTIYADSRDVNMLLLNPAGNNNYLSFEIVLGSGAEGSVSGDGGETLYISGLVAPSMCIEAFKISRPLDEGEYNATLIIRSYDPDSFVAVNSAAVEFDLIAVAAG